MCVAVDAVWECCGWNVIVWWVRGVCVFLNVGS